MGILLTPDFYNRPTLIVAEELLGKFLIMKHQETLHEMMITEVEAYDGFEDRASHAYRGKTTRTSVMFGPPGVWYVYFIYGMYWMLNIVTGPPDYPAGVLIRSAGEYNGPGKLTKYLGIDKSFYGKKADLQTGLWIEDRDFIVESKSIKKTPRIGVHYAGEEWIKKPYRFIIAL